MASQWPSSLFNSRNSPKIDSEEDLQKYLRHFNVQNVWQRTYLAYVWQHAGDPNDYTLRTLCLTYGVQRRLTNIEAECDRFRKYNKAFLEKEFDEISAKTCVEATEYFRYLIEKRHYLLTFTLSMMMIRKCNTFLRDMLMTSILNALSIF